MNLLVIFAIIVVLIVLGRLRLPTLVWVALWPAAVYAFVRLGIHPPVPASILHLYLSLTMVGVLAYVFADPDRCNEVITQLKTFMTEKKYTVPLYLTVLLLPAALAASIYADMTKEVRAPTFGRTVHPAPPNSISFKGKQIDLISAKNPYRSLEASDPEAFKGHVEAGREVYYKNCVYCHGDDMNGDGIFAHALHPVPANFNKGGPGLPEESGPWSSSMPAWEKFLEEEDIWNVILFLYDYTAQKPRAEEEAH